MLFQSVFLLKYSLLTCAFNAVQCMYALRVASDGNQILANIVAKL